MPDPSNGYEAIAGEFMARRTRSRMGVATVARWAQSLPAGAHVLDLGCGHGVPISQTLKEHGLILFGVDASPRMIAAFRARFPKVPAECAAAEESALFGRSFDGVVAWGLIFLLAPDVQSRIINRVSAVLNPGGRFLFTSPKQVCEWADDLTRRKSQSLGSDAYQRLLEAAGLVLVGESEDEGENHYYFARKPHRRPI